MSVDVIERTVFIILLDFFSTNSKRNHSRRGITNISDRSVNCKLCECTEKFEI